MSGALYRRRVGSVRPSHLMFTSGVGALVDLPNFAVLVRGLDDWDYTHAYGWEKIAEPRLLEAVKKLPGNRKVAELRPAPWAEGMDADPNGPASRVGVPISPFPGWFRCTVCNELAALDSQAFTFENANARKPHEARFVHTGCNRGKPLAVAARFVLVCTSGHLDEFPYVHFVHQGGGCPNATHPRLRMDDRGGNIGANVELACVSCGERRNLREAMGQRGEEILPRCRGRHPHLRTYESGGCGVRPKVLVLGASNQWFSQTLSALAVPTTGAGKLEGMVDQHWDLIHPVPVGMYAYMKESHPQWGPFTTWSDAELAAAVEKVRARKDGQDAAPDDDAYPDLRTPEWEVFSAPTAPEPGPDFALRRDPGGVPAELQGVFDDVVQVERLREVRALTGFTRLDAPDPDDPDLVVRVPLSRSDPEWIPASEVRGEGMFLRVPEELLAAWEKRVARSEALALHTAAYRTFRENRYSNRLSGGFDPMRHWPGARYIALHTLSHLLIRTIALDCGYNAASLSERVYAGTEEDPRSGILIYTAVPDAEGTLGGLVSQAEPERLAGLVRRALNEAMRCSSDPLCAERQPQPRADFLHGAACHVCLFVSETTCERGNRFLDRRFVVPIGDPDLALYPELP
ncbi:DrmB family protein [Nocardiopsis sediminis]|uniref:DrmB family protein n=1 Tax=Nocardiopsis sediminis TaxID=1778267 RepID=A0ABV8FH10_9ACTN